MTTTAELLKKRVYLASLVPEEAKGLFLFQMDDEAIRDEYNALSDALEGYQVDGNLDHLMSPRLIPVFNAEMPF